MSQKSIGMVLMIIGVIALAVSLLADFIGIGKFPSAMGPYQLLAAAVGLIIAVIGGIIYFRRGAPKQ